MGYDAKTERLISLKKLAGKAQTSNDKGLSNEALPSGLTLSSETVFGQAISKSPASAALYDITTAVEYIRFVVGLCRKQVREGRLFLHDHPATPYRGDSVNFES